LQDPALYDLGFIILRNVNSDTTNEYWQESYLSIRKFYPENKIIILDDNSNIDFLKCDLLLHNTEIINSVFKSGKGELLPIYYYLVYNWFKKAVIIHDTVFINNYISFENITKYKFLWHIDQHWNDYDTEIKLINQLDNNNELLELYNNNNLWRGCFGCMTVIDHDYLKVVDKKHNFFNLFCVVNCRSDRSALERVFSCMLSLNDDTYNINDISLLNSITSVYYNDLPPTFGCWGYCFNDYKLYKPTLTNMKDRIPIIKVWTGR
jgi:hypothetical protein